MEDDKKLKILFYSMITLSIIVVVGVWEALIKPVISFFINNFDLMINL